MACSTTSLGLCATRVKVPGGRRCRANGALCGMGDAGASSLNLLVLPALRQVLPFLISEIAENCQDSETALGAARFDMNASILAKWNPDEVQPNGGKRYAAQQRDCPYLPLLLISGARAPAH